MLLVWALRNFPVFSSQCVCIIHVPRFQAESQLFNVFELQNAGSSISYQPMTYFNTPSWNSCRKHCLLFTDLRKAPLLVGCLYKNIQEKEWGRVRVIIFCWITFYTKEKQWTSDFHHQLVEPLITFSINPSCTHVYMSLFIYRQY